MTPLYSHSIPEQTGQIRRYSGRIPEPDPGSNISKCFLVGTYNCAINFATSTSVKNWPIFFLSSLEIELRNELVSFDT